ncbi:MAG: RluA family pseudouridine synthase [Candidatus Gracilibacteria bacterium]
MQLIFSILHNQTIRADVFLSALFDGVYSRSQIQKGFATGQIRVWCQKKQEYKKLGKYYPQRGDIVEMKITSTPSSLEPDFRPLEIVFENNDFIVINKDAGINSHPTASPEGKKGTLVNQLIGQIKGFHREVGEDRPGIVHRLDKETSGLILVAKNDITMRKLQKIIHDHKVQKTYLALVIGTPKNLVGTIQSEIGRDPHDRTKMTTKNPIESRHAITHYVVKESFRFYEKTYSLLEVTLETGRTHQIRVHMAGIGHPILGDERYGIENENAFAKKHFGLTRQFLHAWKLVFEMEGEKYNFEGDLKKDLVTTLNHLQKKQGA